MKKEGVVRVLTEAATLGVQKPLAKVTKPACPSVPARPFIPRSSVPRLQHSWQRLVIMPEALEKISLIVEHSPAEVAWLGSVTSEGPIFTLRDVFLFPQEVNDVETHLLGGGMAQFAQEVLDEDPEQGEQLLSTIRLWGHSHGMGSVTPSDQDELTLMRRAVKGKVDWFIRMIANKQGEFHLTLALFHFGLVIADIPWSMLTVRNPDLEKAVLRDLARYVVERPLKESLLASALLAEGDRVRRRGASPRMTSRKGGSDG